MVALFIVSAMGSSEQAFSAISRVRIVDPGSNPAKTKTLRCGVGREQEGQWAYGHVHSNGVLRNLFGLSGNDHDV